MKVSRKFCIAAVAISTVALAIFEIVHPEPFANENLNKSFSAIITRLVGAALFFVVNIYLDHDVLKIRRVLSKKAVYVLPCLIVALNNLPYVAIFRGDAKITGGCVEIIMFAVECALVAIFEELAFRGALFLSLLKGRRSRRGIFLSIIASSIIFGLFHLINLVYGAGFGDTLLQVGYSALVGAMCAFALFKTGSIWISAAIHAVYNFCGQIIPRLGEGSMLNVPQISITVIISMVCAIYIVLSLIKADPHESDRLYKDTE